jgi:hypothetical protein
VVAPSSLAVFAGHLEAAVEVVMVVTMQEPASLQYE